MAKDDKKHHAASKAGPGPGEASPGAGSSELSQPKRRANRHAANRGQDTD